MRVCEEKKMNETKLKKLLIKWVRVPDEMEGDFREELNECFEE